MFRVRAARGRGIFICNNSDSASSRSVHPLHILEIYVHKHTDSLPAPPPTHTHTYIHAGQNDSSARLRARGPSWCCVVCVYSSMWKDLRRGLGSVCMCVCMCVCGLGVWSLARAWGEPADGWDEKRAAVFTLLWGLCMDTGTLPRPLSTTPACTHTHASSHAQTKGTFASFVSHTIKKYPVNYEREL